MQRNTRRILALGLIAVVGTVFGALSAVAGLAIEDWNLTHHGASYPSYRFELLALPALPGMMIAESQFGGDFQLGEIQSHRAPVIGWNALAYATIMSVGYLLLTGCKTLVKGAASQLEPAEQGVDPNA
jgi:tetrahydromethanopterin S-methyltransferase subunit E